MEDKHSEDEKHEEVEDIESDSGDSFIVDSESDEPSISGQDDGLHLEEHLTEEEIEELIAEFLEVESKAAEAQEALELESLVKLKNEVREELAQALHGDDVSLLSLFPSLGSFHLGISLTYFPCPQLEAAVEDEMTVYKEQWEAALDELETESAHLLEQLDGAGIELPSLYRLIENQVPNGCCTEAWKRRAHWVGSQVTSEMRESIAGAEDFLQTERPVRRRHGKLLEEGASGFLQKKIANDGSENGGKEVSDINWNSVNKIFSGDVSEKCAAFGSKHWASVYLASTPQQAAAMGLKFPGVDEVEEIEDVDGNSDDPFVADAIANEKELALSEEQRKKFRKVKEEDDANMDRKLQLHLKRRRHQKRSKQKEIGSVDWTIEDSAVETRPLVDASKSLSNKKTDDGDMPGNNNEVALQNLETGVLESSVKERSLSNGISSVSDSALPDSSELRGIKRSNESEEPNSEKKRSRTIIIGSDEADVVKDECSTKLEDHSVSPENINDAATDNSLHSQSLSEKFYCTACNNVAIEVHPHPILNVIVCKDCKCLLEKKMHVKDADCSECYCVWCGRSSDLVSCKSCKTLFCTTCVKRNISEACLSDEVQASCWQCCCCSPSLLKRLTSELGRAMGSENLIVSSSESDSENSDADNNLKIGGKRKQKKKIRRILDDAELGEETKRKIAIEKERQERLKSLQVQFSSKSKLMNSVTLDGDLSAGASIEVLGDAITGYIVNVVREKGEEAVRIPSSISAKLKAHQVVGIRFMWENIIQSIRKVKSGDKGLGCILAHTMGLGKTFQVIAFLYTAMRSVDLGLRTALIVTPVNVLHNWKQEFMKWRPSELKPLRVFMLEDVSRDRRAELLAKWRAKGGVFLIGYTAFRNLSFGKHVKDRNMAREICHALQDGPDILVCDEAHMIKNTRADTTQALKQVKCQRRIALTGSPLQNNLMEYYCRMDMNVVKKDLPPKTVFVITVKLSPLQRRLYKRFLDLHGFTNDRVSNEKIRKSFFAGYQALAQLTKDKGYPSREDAEDSSSDENMDYNVVIGEKPRNMNDFLQGKNDDGFFQKDWWNDLLHDHTYKELDYSGKMVLLLDILTMCSNMGDKSLVFSQSIPTLDLIEFYLSKLPRPGKQGKLWKKGKDWYRLDGRTESSERQKLVERFNEPLNKRVKCTLISTRAGSLGINLHSANRVIIVDGSWNPTYDLQAIYRAWRYGQRKPVFAYRLMAHGTMEEKIYKRQVTKEGLAARVVDRQQVHRTISKEEMLHLFEFGDDENPDPLTAVSKENGQGSSQNTNCALKHKLPLSHEGCSDKLMESLLGKHHPRWISNYHEHETLLQENEEERLSKEEQDMAWEVFRKSLEWEEVQRVTVDESISERKPASMSNLTPAPETSSVTQPRGILRSHVVIRKCTNLSHKLTLRSQGTKPGCSTVCGECAQEISWENCKVAR
ncbi:protein CHROMATIN REMODELING 20 [Citrus sinensis]|nr:protein CHROMATIN REMODELING 20 [Citrus sinensis]